MKKFLMASWMSASGDSHDMEIAVFSSEEKAEAFMKKNAESIGKDKNYHFYLIDYTKVDLPVDPETLEELRC